MVKTLFPTSQHNKQNRLSWQGLGSSQKASSPIPSSTRLVPFWEHLWASSGATPHIAWQLNISLSSFYHWGSEKYGQWYCRVGQGWLSYFYFALYWNGSMRPTLKAADHSLKRVFIPSQLLEKIEIPGPVARPVRQIQQSIRMASSWNFPFYLRLFIFRACYGTFSIMVQNQSQAAACFPCGNVTEKTMRERTYLADRHDWTGVAFSTGTDCWQRTIN